MAIRLITQSHYHNTPITPIKYNREEMTPAYKEIEDKLEIQGNEYKAFVAATLKLRQAQKKYLESRTPDNFRAVKIAEGNVDKLIRNYGQEAVKDRQEKANELF